MYRLCVLVEAAQPPDRREYLRNQWDKVVGRERLELPTHRLISMTYEVFCNHVTAVKMDHKILRHLALPALIGFVSVFFKTHRTGRNISDQVSASRRE